MTSDVSSAEDLAQETFLAAWKSLPDYEHRSSFRTWLFAIASRKVIDLHRRSVAIPVEDSTFERVDRGMAGPYDSYVGSSLFEALQHELKRLSHHSRACWWLREVEGLSHEQIATALSITHGSVRGHLQRAREQLSTRLAPWNPTRSQPRGKDN